MSVQWARTTPKWPFRTPSQGEGTPYTRWAKELQTRPGRWAAYPGTYVRTKKNANNIAWQINSNRRPTTLPAAKFEAKVDVDNNIWVRARPKPRKRAR